jgi:4-methyl-5(b-hydroxyethyl)-thiazole monophosphate biosynthesis
MSSTVKVLVPLADGFEEIEAVTVIDTLRRADIEVVTADLGGADAPRWATGSHAIRIATESSLDAVTGGVEADGALAVNGLAGFTAIVLAGGMPGAAALRDDARVQGALRAFAESGKLVAAICAAPIALAAAGVLEGRRATAYPAFRDQLAGATVVHDQRVVTDGNLMTSAGPGTALEFALRLVAHLTSRAKADELAKAMLLADLALVELVRESPER